MEVITPFDDVVLAIDQLQPIEFYEKKMSTYLINQAKSKYRNSFRQIEFLASHYLLAQITYTEQTYFFDINNKPVAEKTKHYLSISHSDTMIALIASNKYRVGIDIEDAQRDVTRIAQKFINNSEQQWANTNNDWLLIWTAKEALYKLLINPDSNFKDGYVIYPNNKAKVRLFPDEWFDLHVIKNDNFVLTWVVK